MRLHLLFALLAGLVVALASQTSAQAAPVLTYTQSCNGDKVDLAFAWTGGVANAQGLYVSINQTDNTFADATTTSSGPFLASVKSFLWPSFPQGTFYYARFVQQLADGTWDSSAILQITTRTCDGSAPPPAAAAPAPSGPASIRTLTCTGSGQTATLTDVKPASTQTAQMQVSAGDTVSCTVDVAGDYTGIAWKGPSSDGSGTSFSTAIGPARQQPYIITATVSHNGNPIIGQVSIGSVAGVPQSSGSGGGTGSSSGIGTGGGNQTCNNQGGIEVCIGSTR
jgi:hypothetical protein